jgi:hypothetical protein
LPDVAATTQPAKPTAGAPLQPSVANARAEYSPARDGRNLAAAEPATAAASGSSAFNGAQDSDPQAAAAQRWSLASRWSDQGEAGNVNNGPSSTEEAADQPAAIPHNARSVPLTNAPTATAPPVQSTINSIWMLLGALVGALALAGGLVGTIAKLGSGPKPTVRRDINGRPDIWGAALSEGKQSASRSPIIDEPECFQPPMNWIKVARERHSAQSQSDEIERLLARAPRRSA